MPRVLRSVAMALLDVRPALMQRSMREQRLSPRGRLRPIDLGLLWIAELDATGFGGGQRMACALADNVARGLGSAGELVNRQPFGPGHTGNSETEALAVHQRGDEGDAAAKATSFATSRVALRFLASTTAAAICGR